MKKETKNDAGELHSFNDEPAFVSSDGHKAWYQNGQWHRVDGPAVIRPNGDKIWHQNGKKHRLDGPAIEYVNGYKVWYQNGKKHRSDGPAVKWPDGFEEYYIEDEHLTKQEFLTKTKAKEIMTKKPQDEDDKPHSFNDESAVKYTDEIKYRYTNEELHHLGARYFHIEGEAVNEEVSLLAEAQAENDELRKDLQFFMEQSVIIEHKQDHKQLRKLREKYGFKW